MESKCRICDYYEAGANGFCKECKNPKRISGYCSGCRTRFEMTEEDFLVVISHQPDLGDIEPKKGMTVVVTSCEYCPEKAKEVEVKIYA